ncbi:MAG: patatin-like phospholipase family protein [Pseudomonadota bacterium]
MTDIGLALGGGGAKGLAHICMLEVIDEFGIEPSRIVGTSIGAIVGVLYASGMSARTLREEVQSVSHSEKNNFAENLENIFNWLQLVEVNWKGGSLLKVDAFLDDLMEHVKISNFEELRMPLKVVAADFWNRNEVVIDSGDIRTAVHASMALPGVFEPAIVDGRVLVDGGVTNPVPYDLIMDECDVTIAIDVMGNRTESAGLVPSLSESVFNTFQIMQKSILRHKIAARPPDIYVCPEIVDILMLEFHEAEKIFAQAGAAADQLRRELEGRLLGANRAV